MTAWQIAAAVVGASVIAGAVFAGLVALAARAMDEPWER